MAVRLSSLNDRNPPSRGVDRQTVLLGRKVVVVDDSSSQRRRLSEMFESLGMVVVGEASHGLECLAVVERTRPELISLDVIMPVMHGVETLGYLREGKSTAAIIFVSAMGHMDAMAEVRAPGGFSPDAIFSKKDAAETFKEVLTAIFMGDEDSVRPSQTKAVEEATPATPVPANRAVS